MTPETESLQKISKQPPELEQYDWSEAKSALDDIQKTFGFIPSFVSRFTEQSIPGAWAAVKNIYFSSNTAIEPKIKSLIGLAIAAQIPCEEIRYFDQTASLAFGATEQEQQEAILMSAILRHWSSFINGAQLDKAEFRTEVDKVMKNIKKMMDDSGGKLPDEKEFLVKPSTPEEAYNDIEKTLGFVPQFFQLYPKEGIAGAWSEFKGAQLNPYTSLNGKQKELIGLAVAAQIPCEYCVYFHRSAARLNGATDREIQEAIAMSGLARHWSTIFHGPKMDLPAFQKDADRMLEGLKQKIRPQQLHS